MCISQDLKPYTEALLACLKGAGVESIHISFDGGGDSGSIVDVAIAGGDASNLKVTWPQTTSSYVDDRWVETTTVVEVTVTNALKAWCYAELEKTHLDWYNDEGGYGTLTVEFSNGEMKLEVYTRYIETDYARYDLRAEAQGGM